MIFTFLLVLSVLLIQSCRKNEISETTIRQNQTQISPTAVNLNTASVAELEKLPHIGTQTAHGIVAFREKHGRFRRTENLILIDGMSDKKFREIRHLVRVE